MPDAKGNFRGISVPRIPWHEYDDAPETRRVYSLKKKPAVSREETSAADGKMHGDGQAIETREAA